MPDGEEGGTDEARRVPNRMPDLVGEVVSASDAPDTRRRQVGTGSTPFGILSPGLGSETLETRPQPAIDALLQTQSEAPSLPIPASRLAPHVETHEVGGDDLLMAVGELFILNSFENAPLSGSFGTGDDPDGDATDFTITNGFGTLIFGVSKLRRLATKEKSSAPDAAIWDSSIMAIDVSLLDAVEPDMDTGTINRMNLHRHDIHSIRKLRFVDTDNAAGITVGLQSRGDASGAILEVASLDEVQGYTNVTYRRLRLADPVGDDDATTKRYVDGLTAPVAAEGDIIIGDATPAWIVLSIGAARELLQVNAGGTRPEWASNIDIPGTLDVTGAVVLDSTLQIGADVILSRGAANRLDLATGDNLRLVSGDLELIDGKVIDIFAAFGDANPKARLEDDRISFGPGGATALDWVLRRNDVGSVRMGVDQLFQGEAATAGTGSTLFELYVSGETFARLALLDDAINFGGGASNADVSLSRKSANVLELSVGDTFNVDTIAETTGAAGVTIDGVLLKDGLVDGVDIAARDHAEAHAAASHSDQGATGAELETLTDGSETTLHSHAGGGGAVATDAIWDVKGDLAGGTGADTAARLAVGANGTVLGALSSEITGLVWLARSGTAQIADIAAAESAGSNTTIPFGDHVHAHPSGLGTGLHHNQTHDEDSTDHTNQDYVIKSADESVTNSATLQNDNALLFAIGASEQWAFEFFIIFTSDTTPDIKFTVTVPSGAAGDFVVSETPGASADNPTYRGGVSFGTSISIAVDAAAKRGVHIFGVVDNSTNAGDVTLQWAQRVSNATPATVYQYSWLRAVKVA